MVAGRAIFSIESEEYTISHWFAGDDVDNDSMEGINTTAFDEDEAAAPWCSI